MEPTFLRLAVLATTVALGQTGTAFAQAGNVLDEQKISDTAGSFTGVLADNDNFGISVVEIGDLDNDGIEDLAVGSYFDDDGNAAGDRGAVWILFMNADGTVDSSQKISDTAGGFTGTLDDGDNFGHSVAALGDLDGDGVEDIAVGATGDDDLTAGGGDFVGAVWILFLNTDGTVDGFQKISDTTGGFGGGLDSEDFFGRSMAGLGDLDGDMVEDLAVGAHGDNEGGDNRGTVWILFLNTDGTVKGQQEISDTQGGFDGVLDDLDAFGVSIANVGDLDNDLVTDIAVGAFGDDDGGDARGAVWILFLNTDGTVSSNQKISDTAGGFTGVLDDNDSFGISASGLGDLDGDDIEDLVVGATGDDDDGGSNRGAVWVLFLDTDGTVDGFQKISDAAGGLMEALADFDQFGISVAGLTDLDGDGIKDLAVGAHTDDDGGSGRGAVYALFLDGVSTLPVELVAFEGLVDGRDVVLTWRTATETNNAGFEVQQAGTEDLWMTVGFVPGAGTTTESVSYSHRISDLDVGLQRFRLKQVDYDGAFEFSPVVEVLLEVPNRVVVSNPYPNPVSTHARLSVAVSTGQHVRVELHSVLGRELSIVHSGLVDAGELRDIHIDTSGLSAGVYLIRVWGDGFEATRSVVVRR